MNDVVLKGSRDGLTLIISQASAFSDVLNQLKDKLEAASEFLTTTMPVRILNETDFFTSEERQQITGLLATYGLLCEDGPLQVMDETDKEKNTKVSEGIELESLLVAKTLRGGQKVVHHGSIVVTGDVNPGAQVIAGGNIIVMGACRGTAHAGAYGDESATITAGRLVASQLRIAGIIARAPDVLDKSDVIETARIVNGVVVIEPANK